MKKKTDVRFVIEMIALLAIFILLIILLMRDNSVTSAPESNNETILSAETGSKVTDEGPMQRSDAEILEDLNRQVAEGMITMSMNPDPVFASGDSEGNLFIHNDEENNHAQVVQIYRDDTEELIYHSGAIPVGKYVNSDKLSVNLPAGDYPCVAYFHAIDEISGEVLGVAAVHITIHVNG